MANTPTESLSRTNSLDRYLATQAEAEAVQVEQSAASNPAQSTGFLLKPFVPTAIPTYLHVPPHQPVVVEGEKPAPERVEVVQEEVMELHQAQQGFATIVDDQPMISGSVTVTPSESKSWAVTLWNTETKGNKLGFGFLKLLVGILFVLGDIFINLPYQAYSSWKKSKAVTQISLNSTPAAQPAITLQPVPAPTASTVPNTSVPVVQMNHLEAPVADSDEILADSGINSFEAAIQADLQALSEPVQQTPVAQTTPALDKLAEIPEEEMDLGAFLASAERSAPQPKKIFSADAVRAAFPSEAEKKAKKAEAAKAKAEAARIAAEPARIQKLYNKLRSKEVGMIAQLEQVQQKMRNEYLDRSELEGRLAKKLGPIRDAGKDPKTTDQIINNFNRECEVEGRKLAAFAAGPKPITQKVGNETLTVKGTTENSENILKAVANLENRLKSVVRGSYTTGATATVDGRTITPGFVPKANDQALNLILVEANAGRALEKSFLASLSREMQESQENGLDFLDSVFSAIQKIDEAVALGIAADDAKLQFLADNNCSKSVVPALGKEFQEEVAESGFNAALDNLKQKLKQVNQLETLQNPNFPGLDEAYIYSQIFTQAGLGNFDLIEADRQKKQAAIGYVPSVISALDQIKAVNALIGASQEATERDLDFYLQKINFQDNYLPALKEEFAKDCGSDVLTAIDRFYEGVRSANQVGENDILPLIKDDIRAGLMNEFQKRANPQGLVSAGPDLAHYAGKQLIEAINKFGFAEDVRKTLEETVQSAIYYPLVSHAALLMIEWNDFSLEAMEFLRKGFEEERDLNPAHSADFCHDVQDLLNDEQARRTLVAEQKAREEAEAARIAAEQQAQEAAQAAQAAAMQQALAARAELEQQASIVEANLTQLFDAQVASAKKLISARELLDNIMAEMNVLSIMLSKLKDPLTDQDGTTRSFAEWQALNSGNPDSAQIILARQESAYSDLDKEKTKVLAQIIKTVDQMNQLGNQYTDNLRVQRNLLRASPILGEAAEVVANERGIENDHILALVIESINLAKAELVKAVSNQEASQQASLNQQSEALNSASPVSSGRRSPLSLSIPTRGTASENESIREDQETVVGSTLALDEEGDEDLLNQPPEVVLTAPDADYVFQGTPPGTPKH